jgi:hypothetical protein
MHQRNDQKLFRNELKKMNFCYTYKKRKQNLDECCNYVMKCAKEGNGGYSDDEVSGWAVHYYDEDDIKTSSL